MSSLAALTPDGPVAVWNIALDYVGESQPIVEETARTVAGKACRRHYGRVLKEVLEARVWPFAKMQAPISDVSSQTETHTGDGVKTTFLVAFAFRDPGALTVVKIVGGVRTTLTAATQYTLAPVADSASGALDRGRWTVTPVVLLAGGEQLELTVAISRIGWEHLYTLPSDCVTPVALLADGSTRLALTPKDQQIPWELQSNEGGDGALLCTNAGAGDLDRLEYVAFYTHVPSMPATFIDAVAWRLAAALCDPLRKDIGVSRRCWGEYILALSRATATTMRAGGNDPVEEPETPSIAARD